MNKPLRILGHLKRPHPRMHRVEKGAEIQAKSIENLFNKIMHKTSQILLKIHTSKYRRYLEPLVDMTRKEPLHTILQLKCQTREQRKDIESCKRKMPTYLQRQTHQNYI
jgi:hypothetical protein